MKRNLVALSVLCASLAPAFAFGADAETIVTPGGTVHFVGQVVNGTCAVDAGSVDQTVQMGQVRANTLNKVGDVSENVGFSIVLNECAPGAASDVEGVTLPTTAAIIFSGVTVGGTGSDGTVTTNPTILSLQSSAAGMANNVGIQVLDRAGKPVSFDGKTASTATTLTDGTNILPFQARYTATGKATAGTANADATFTIQYQ